MHDNIISPNAVEKHNIARYDFKVLNRQDVVDPVEENRKTPFEVRKTNQIFSEETHKSLNPEVQAPQTTSTPEPQISNAQSAPASAPPPNAAFIDKELIEKLLTKTDELSTRLAGMQENFEKQQQEFDTRLQEEKQAAYNQGFEKGMQESAQQLESTIEEAKSAFVESVESINKKAGEFDTTIANLEKELSAIAIDIAKEVIIAEVEEKGSEIALSLATELLENIKDASKATIKLNPHDFDYIKDRLPEDSRISVEKDRAIAKGGVVIISDSGNIDGTVMARYHTLKQAILENQQDTAS